MAGNRLRERVAGFGTTVVAQSAADGALPTLFAATAPAASLADAVLIGPRGLLQLRGAPGPVEPRPRPRDLTQDVAGRLWTASEQLTGVVCGPLGRTA